MSQDTYELKAELRERVGKGSSRELRRNGLIPAVIYGDKQEPIAISLPNKEVTLKIHAGGFMTTIGTIDVGGKKIRVLPKDYQLDPVRDFTMHVDFLRVSANTLVNVNVPVHFVNEEKAPGIKIGMRPAAALQRALGHAKSTTTLTTYAHLWPNAESRVRDASARLAAEVLGFTEGTVRAESR